jgi:predicted MFS family arabinose efflux permease
MILLGVSLRFLLPKNQPMATMGYGKLIKSMVGFIKTEPVLRESTLNGMLLYGALTAFWATLVFLVASPAYQYGPAAAGMFGIVAAGGAIIAPRIGRLADRISPHVTVAVATAAMVAAYLILWIAGKHLAGLIIGVLLLDMAAQSATISNQTMVTGLNPLAQSRLYTVYRAAYSVGGSVGAFLGVWGWTVDGWNGVCAVGTGMVSLALLLHLAARRTEAIRSARIEREASFHANT